MLYPEEQFKSGIPGYTISKAVTEERPIFKASDNEGKGEVGDSAGEIIKSAPKHIRSNVKDVDAWKHIDEHLGNKPVTDINPFKGKQELDRMFSQQANGNWRSLRIGDHEMEKGIGRGFHYHLEEWTPDGKFIKPD